MAFTSKHSTVSSPLVESDDTIEALSSQSTVSDQEFVDTTLELLRELMASKFKALARICR
jgi:hypothetical protein